MQKSDNRLGTSGVQNNSGEYTTGVTYVYITCIQCMFHNGKNNLMNL